MHRALIFLFIALALGSCAAPPRAMFTSPPQFVELAREERIATVHFPRGVYSLDQTDRTGWFYRSPAGVMEHAFGTFVRHDGGIFISRDRTQARGYMIWAGGRTKLGSISRDEIRFTSN